MLKPHYIQIPPDLLKNDIEYVRNGIVANSPIGNGISEIITALSVLGHVHQGHGMFRGIATPNATLCDLINVSEEFEDGISLEVRRKAAYHILAAYEALESLLEASLGMPTNKAKLLKKPDGMGYILCDPIVREKTGNIVPLFGIETFLSNPLYEIQSPHAALQGAMLASRMDSGEWRAKALESFSSKFPPGKGMLNIGYGESYVGDFKKIKKIRGNGLDLKSLANTKPDSRILTRLQEDEVLLSLPIPQNSDEFRDHLNNVINGEFNPNLLSIYVRENNSEGCCDDASLLGIGLMYLNRGQHYATSALLGATLMDIVDTLDKAVGGPIHGGFDELIGKLLSKKYKKLGGGMELVSEEETCKIIYFGAQNNHPPLKFSSSVRVQQQFPFQSTESENAHIAYLRFLNEGVLTRGIPLGFSKVESMDFFYIIKIRYNAMMGRGLFPFREYVGLRDEDKKRILTSLEERNTEQERIRKKREREKRRRGNMSAKRKAKEKKIKTKKAPGAI